jgi:hypothetical protein
VDNLVPIVVLCGVGADLFSLPLLICTVLAVLQVVPVDIRLQWMGAWWMVAVAMAVTAAEITIDTVADRRRRFFRRAWPVLQHVLSAMVSVVVVHTLGTELNGPERVATLAAAWITTGVIKAGAVEKFKNIVEWLLPG